MQKLTQEQREAIRKRASLATEKGNGSHEDAVMKQYACADIAALLAEIERLREELAVNEMALNASNTELARTWERHEDMTSIALWAARRVHKTHKDFAYDEIERNLGREVERV